MIKEINIGCASTNTSYGKRLDTTLVELNSKANVSALFTSNKFKSAPVQVCLSHIMTKKKGRKILAINAGNANAATGKKGVSDTKKLVKEISDLSGVPSSHILPFSTGVVGQLLNTKSLSLASKQIRIWFSLHFLTEKSSGETSLPIKFDSLSLSNACIC